MSSPFDDDDDEGEEGYMATFADMMTLLLGFFMILYSLSNMDEKRFYEFGKAISESISKEDAVKKEQIFQEMELQEKQIKAFQMLVSVLNLQNSDQAYKKINKLYQDYLVGQSSYNAIAELATDVKGEGFLKELITSRDAYVTILTFPTDQIFTTKTSVELKPNSEASLTKLAGVLTSLSKVSEVLVEVHGDPREKLDTAWETTSKQALVLGKKFVKFGIKQRNLIASGRANHSPVVDPLEVENRNKNLLSKNSRIEIKIRSVK